MLIDLAPVDSKEDFLGLEDIPHPKHEASSQLIVTTCILGEMLLLSVVVDIVHFSIT